MAQGTIAYGRRGSRNPRIQGGLASLVLPVLLLLEASQYRHSSISAPRSEPAPAETYHFFHKRGDYCRIDATEVQPPHFSGGEETVQRCAVRSLGSTARTSFPSRYF